MGIVFIEKWTENQNKKKMRWRMTQRGIRLLIPPMRTILPLLLMEMKKKVSQLKGVHHIMKKKTLEV